MIISMLHRNLNKWTPSSKWSRTRRPTKVLFPVTKSRHSSSGKSEQIPWLRLCNCMAQSMRMNSSFRWTTLVIHRPSYWVHKPVFLLRIPLGLSLKLQVENETSENDSTSSPFGVNKKALHCYNFHGVKKISSLKLWSRLQTSMPKEPT